MIFFGSVGMWKAWRKEKGWCFSSLNKKPRLLLAYLLESQQAATSRATISRTVHLTGTTRTQALMKSSYVPTTHKVSTAICYAACSNATRLWEWVPSSHQSWSEQSSSSKLTGKSCVQTSEQAVSASGSPTSVVVVLCLWSLEDHVLTWQTRLRLSATRVLGKV